MILIKEVNNWLLQDTKYDNNMHKAYVLTFGQFMERFKKSEKGLGRKYQNQPISILKPTK